MPTKELQWPGVFCRFFYSRLSFPRLARRSDMDAPTLAQSPQILLLVKTDKNHHYFRPSDLKKLPRTVITIVDAVTNSPHMYDGVALDQLLPGIVLSSPGVVVEIEFDTHQKISFPTSDLDTQVKAIIADTIDGKPLFGDAPYWFVAKSRSKAVQKITDVQTINVH